LRQHHKDAEYHLIPPAYIPIVKQIAVHAAL